MYAVDYISTDITDFGLRRSGPVGGGLFDDTTSLLVMAPGLRYSSIHTCTNVQPEWMR